MSQVNLNSQVNFDNSKYIDFENKFCNVLKDGEGQWDEHKVVSGLPGENQTSVTVTDSPGGVKAFFGSIGRFFRRVFSFGLAQADKDLKSISLDFHKSVADIFGGEHNIPDGVRTALGTHGSKDGKMRPLSSHRIKIVNAALFALKPAANDEVQAEAEVVPANNENVGEQPQVEEQAENKVEEQPKVDDDAGIKVLEGFINELDKKDQQIAEMRGKTQKYLEDLKQALQKEKNDYLEAYRNDVLSLKLNKSGVEAAVARMGKLLDEKIKDQMDDAKHQADTAMNFVTRNNQGKPATEKEIADCGKQFDADGIQTRKGALKNAAEEEKQKIAKLVEDFQKGTSEAFNNFFRAYLKTFRAQMQDLITNDSLAATKCFRLDVFSNNKKDINSWIDEELKNLKNEQSENKKTFLEHAQAWIDEVITNGEVNEKNISNHEGLEGDKKAAAENIKGIGEKLVSKFKGILQEKYTEANTKLGDVTGKIANEISSYSTGSQNYSIHLGSCANWVDEAQMQSFFKEKAAPFNMKARYELVQREYIDLASKVQQLSYSDMKKAAEEDYPKVLAKLKGGRRFFELFNEKADMIATFLNGYQLTVEKAGKQPFDKEAFKNIVTASMKGWIADLDGQTLSGGPLDENQFLDGFVARLNLEMKQHEGFKDLPPADLNRDADFAKVHKNSYADFKINGDQDLANLFGGETVGEKKVPAYGNWLNVKLFTAKFNAMIDARFDKYVATNENFKSGVLRRHNFGVLCAQRVVRNFAAMMNLYCGVLSGVAGNRKDIINLSSSEVTDPNDRKLANKEFVTNLLLKTLEDVLDFKGYESRVNIGDEQAFMVSEQSYSEGGLQENALKNLESAMKERAKTITNWNKAVPFVAADGETSLIESAKKYLK